MFFPNFQKLATPQLALIPLLAACGPTALEVVPGDSGSSTFEDTMLVALRFYDIGSGAQVQWAQLCVEDRNDIACETANEYGEVIYSVAAEGPTVLVAKSSNPDYMATRLIVEPVDSPSFVDIPMMTWELLEFYSGYWGFPLQPGRGHMLLRALGDSPDGGAESVQFWREPTRGQGPYYFNTTSQPDSKAESTNTHGYGFILNGAEGEMTAGAEHLGVPCEPVAPLFQNGQQLLTNFSAADDSRVLTVGLFDCGEID